MNSEIVQVFSLSPSCGYVFLGEFDDHSGHSPIIMACCLDKDDYLTSFFDPQQVRHDKSEAIYQISATEAMHAIMRAIVKFDKDVPLAFAYSADAVSDIDMIVREKAARMVDVLHPLCVETFRKKRAVKRIQSAWFRAYYDPLHPVCRRRIVRQFTLDQAMYNNNKKA